jgi:hypothetical protein
MSQLWFRRLLSLCPIAISVLWVAGVTRFRGYSLETQEWLVVVAAAFSLHVLTRRLRRPKPLPPLPERTNPLTLAALAAALVAGLALVIGGTLELLVDSQEPSATSWALRSLWHGACAFGACYCAFLHRLLQSGRKARDAA